MGSIIGYARVSTGQQDYQLQVDRLTAAGAVRVFAEKGSGLDGERPVLAECLRYVRDEDTLVITKLDRLARSTSDLYRIVTDLTNRGVAFKVLDDAMIDTTSRTGKLVMGILALIAEFETDIRRERQMEGIARAKAEGRTGGRPKVIDDETHERVLTLRADGKSVRDIAKELGISKTSVHKLVS